MVKKIWIILVLLSLCIAVIWFTNEIKNNPKQQTNTSSLDLEKEKELAEQKKLEEEKEQFTKEEVQNKVSQIKKKMKLKEIISKANMYFDEDEYMFSLIEFQKVLKEVPNDEVTNIKVWDIYYKIHKYWKANEYYSKVKKAKSLDKDKAILSLINDKWVSKENIDELTKKINEFDISEEKKFYYTTSIICVVDYSLCRDKFQKYFEKNWSPQSEELKNLQRAFESFKNFKNNDLYYKAAFITWAFFENAFYYVALKTSEQILWQKYNYRPIMEIAAKSSYEIGDYISAKKYLNDIKKIDPNNSEMSYFLARVYEKLNDKNLALVQYKKALADNYKDQIDIKRRIVFLFFESKDYKKMLSAFDDLLKTKSDKLNINDYSLAIYYNIINDDEQKANLYIDQAIEKFPKSELFYWYKAWIMLEKDNLLDSDLKEIKENIDKAMAIKRNSLILMANWIYELKMKNYEKAIVNLKSAYWMDKSWEYKEKIDFWLQKVAEERNNN